MLRAYKNYQTSVLLGLIIVIVFIICIDSWISDDAFISYRVIDNFMHGYGLRWNISERVQVFTHPLWVLFQIPFVAIFHSIPTTSLIASVSLTALSLIIAVFAIAKKYINAVLVLLLAGISQAFIDYATSGLENALGYVIIGLFFSFYLQTRSSKNILLLTILASLLYLVRNDLMLLVLIPLIVTFWKHRSAKTLGITAIGLMPAILWESFALIYYGFFFPNTAYAKLNVDIPKIELIGQGVRYAEERFFHDPVTIICILLAIVICFINREMRILRPFAIGLILYSIYVIYIGGDFMAGRFFSIPFFISILIFSRLEKNIVPIAILLCCLPLAFLSPTSHLLQKNLKSPIFFNGIADERVVYQPWTKLLANPASHDWAKAGASLKGGTTTVSRDNIGLFGFYAGPTVYIIDTMALADPFLARISMLKHEQSEHTTYTWWRIGHFQRTLPEDYEALRKGEQNQLPDTKLNDRLKTIRLITEGRIWTIDRWKAILSNQ